MLVNRRLRRLLMVLVAGLVLAGVGAAAGEVRHQSPRGGHATVTFGLGPSDGTKVDGRPYFYYAAAPRAVIKDHVIVLNYSRQVLHLQLYATDAYNSPDGANSLLQAGQSPKDLGAWTRLGTGTSLLAVPGRRTDLDPPGRAIVPFEVHVLKDAAAGDHVAGMVAALRTYATNAQGLSIPLDQRVATQIFLRVAGPLNPALRVEDLQTSYVDNWNPLGRGRVRVSYTVHNVGNVRLGASQRVTASGLIGAWSARSVPDVPLLVPGGKAHVQVEVRGVWPEFWMPATVRIKPLKLQTDVNPPMRAVSAERHFWAIPWVLLAVLALLLVGVRRLLRRLARRDQDTGPTGGEGPGGPEDPVTPPPGHTPKHLRPEPDALPPFPLEPVP